MAITGQIAPPTWNDDSKLSQVQTEVRKALNDVSAQLQDLQRQIPAIPGPWVDYPSGTYIFPSGGVSVSAGKMPIGAVTTSPTKGTVVLDQMQYRTYGQKIEIRMVYVQNGAGTAGSGSYLWPLPLGLTMPTGTTVSTVTAPGQPLGFGTIEAGASGQRMAVAMAYNATTFRILTYNAMGSTVLNDVSSVDFHLNFVSIKYTILISI